MNQELIEEFKNREIKAKQIFVIDEISKVDNTIYYDIIIS